ncbi:MAG: hypothetical protein ABJH98_13860 [Reichenbachiella sp.]|uniref:hypothetical protein n=1 Tax=Reichenbachiella sp. TaxID=2184521 RepID=UPI00329A5F53
MKNILYIYILASAVLFSSCNDSEDLMTDGAMEGAILNISGSSGSLAGAPAAGMDLADAEIEFQLAELNYNIGFEGNSGLNVDKLIVTKTYDGQTVEVAEANGGKNGSLSVEYSSLSDYLEGFDGVSESDLRIGDVIAFKTVIVMNDGRELDYPSGNLSIGISCLADLSGTYMMTNTVCPTSPSLPREVTITKNADGSWHLTRADGGLLSTCSTNTTLLNAGNIIEQCGEILPSIDLDFGSAGGSYDIGDIAGGTWDAASGTLTMEHTQSFFSWAGASYTSTYVRQ